MLIVLEGCDCTGKSTLAKKLATLLDAEIIHCSTHTANNLPFFEDIIEASQTRNIVADRWMYGQFVYQDKDDRPLEKASFSRNVVGEAALSYLETTMLKAGAKVILVTADAEDVKARLNARGETLINGKTVEEVQAGFEALKEHSLLSWLVYNTSKGGELIG